MNRTDLLNALVTRGYSVEEHATTKNGVILNGFIFRVGNISPVVYVDEILRRANADGLNLDEVVDEVIDAFSRANTPIDFSVELLKDKSFVFPRLRVGVQRVGSENIVKRVSEMYDGIEEYLYITDAITSDDGFVGTIKVTDQIARGYDIAEMWETAYNNTFENCKLCSMAEMLGMPEEMFPAPMYCITNESKTKGAAGMLNKKLLKAFALDMGVNKLVVIPSSIHEVLVLPYDGKADISFFSDMVLSVNAEQVDPVEQLGDKAYLISID